MGEGAHRQTVEWEKVVPLSNAVESMHTATHMHSLYIAYRGSNFTKLRTTAPDEC